MRLTQSSSGLAGRIASGVFLTLLGVFGLWFVIYDLGYVLIFMLKMPFSGLRFPLPPRFLWEDPPPERTWLRRPDRTTELDASD